MCLHLSSNAPISDGDSNNFINPKKRQFICNLPTQPSHTIKLTQPPVYKSLSHGCVSRHRSTNTEVSYPSHTQWSTPRKQQVISHFLAKYIEMKLSYECIIYVRWSPTVSQGFQYSSKLTSCGLSVYIYHSNTRDIVFNIWSPDNKGEYARGHGFCPWVSVRSTPWLSHLILLREQWSKCWTWGFNNGSQQTSGNGGR